MKTIRDGKVSFVKMGNGKGAKVNLSIPLLKTLEITEEEREVKIEYDDTLKQITIKKK
ncbi:hypothetical protein [Sneathia sanguinegens]|jgi:hypothetical protein|uniref:hypothetical protein n=1 Tax=Sneathia sanguinegens TaxID=40543 RepID=UPI00288C1772|nr:hypothetical protein [Sneathia sanguinegens]